MTAPIASIAVEPMGRFLYVSHTTDQAIEVFAIDPISGALQARPGSPGTQLPGGVLAVHPSGRYLYMNAGSGLNAYTVNPDTGALSLIAGSPFVSVIAGRRVAIDRTTTYMYSDFLVTTPTPGESSYGRIESATGVPLRAGAFVVPAGTGLVGLQASPVSDFIYGIQVAPKDPGLLAMAPGGYAIASDGTLSRLPLNGTCTSVCQSLLPLKPWSNMDDGSYPWSGSVSIALEPSGKLIYYVIAGAVIKGAPLDPVTGVVGPWGEALRAKYPANAPAYLCKRSANYSLASAAAP